MSPVKRSLVELNVSVFLLGLVPLFAKLIPLGPDSIIFYRCVFGAAGLLLFLRLRGMRFALQRPRDYVLVVLVGVLLAVHWVTYFQSIQVSTVAVAITSIFIYPAITVVIEPLLSRRLPRPLDLLLALIALGGVVLIVPEFSLEGSTGQGVAWGVLSALLFALRNVTHRHWLRDYPSTQMMGYQMAVALVVLVALAEDPRQIQADAWLGLAVLGLVFTAFAHSLFVGSMRHLQAKTASLIASLQPAYSIIAAALLLGEMPGGRTLLGAAVVVSVAVIESLRTPQRAKPEDAAD